MICYIYRSNKKLETYLYVVEKGNFNQLPEALLNAFGVPEYSMTINLATRTSLARVDINLVKEKLTRDGFFLQLPPVDVTETLSKKLH